jgi:hypothetical protein
MCVGALPGFSADTVLKSKLTSSVVRNAQEPGNQSVMPQKWSWAGCRLIGSVTGANPAAPGGEVIGCIVGGLLLDL